MSELDHDLRREDFEAIRESVMPQDGWGGEDWDYALCEAAINFWNRRATPSPAPIQQCLPHGHREDFYLMANARIMLSRCAAYMREPNWVIAMNLFATGSTSANAICHVAGIDPDSTKVQRIKASAPTGAAQGGNTNPCKACNGEGVIHTGIEEAPTSDCRKCDGSGIAPTVKAGQ